MNGSEGLARPSDNIPHHSGNLLLYAENLQALSAMQHHYKQTFDVLYIDPPYNTGRSFTYDDSLRKSWFSMLQSRLCAAKDLLTEDAVIFVSIGDEEVHRQDVQAPIETPREDGGRAAARRE